MRTERDRSVGLMGRLEVSMISDTDLANLVRFAAARAGQLTAAEAADVLRQLGHTEPEIRGAARDLDAAKTRARGERRVAGERRQLRRHRTRFAIKVLAITVVCAPGAGGLVVGALALFEAATRVELLPLFERASKLGGLLVFTGGLVRAGFRIARDEWN
jgi:hypothetical protein